MFFKVWEFFSSLQAPSNIYIYYIYITQSILHILAKDTHLKLHKLPPARCWGETCCGTESDGAMRHEALVPLLSRAQGFFPAQVVPQQVGTHRYLRESGKNLESWKSTTRFAAHEPWENISCMNQQIFCPAYFAGEVAPLFQIPFHLHTAFSTCPKKPFLRMKGT